MAEKKKWIKKDAEKGKEEKGAEKKGGKLQAMREKMYGKGKGK